jgi:hypothetical protein
MLHEVAEVFVTLQESISGFDFRFLQKLVISALFLKPVNVELITVAVLKNPLEILSLIVHVRLDCDFALNEINIRQKNAIDSIFFIFSKLLLGLNV